MFQTLTHAERQSLFDQRYRMETLIGAGGGGQVWRALDTDTNLPVAVKQIQVFSTAHRARVRREIGALRLLQIPGVVKLIDVGEVYSEPYIVMELLTGAPFPGRVGTESWQVVARRALALCETLDRVHTLGVVHRDLKPGNVIVEDNGRVVLLDFGLARGEDLANTVTEDGGIVGTLRYLAPEQLRGGVPEPRTDLYSFGVMLYEALGGRRQIDEISNLRAWAHGPPDEGRTAPLLDVPESLSDLVLRMMNVLITRRPASAREVAEGLAAVLGETLAPPVQVPFCGRAAVVDALLTAALQRRSGSVWGPEGSGRTRLLREVHRRVSEIGLPTCWLPAGERPFSSLEPLLGELPQGPGTLSAAHDRLVEALREGLVVFADDFLKLDLWSRRAIERARSEGAVITVADLPGAAQLEPLTEVELRPLFHGPDAFLHLVEDGASLLHVRTRGIASRVARELRTWAATGRMSWNTTGARPVLECARADLEELEAWPGVALYGLGGAVDVTLAPALAEVLAWVVVSGGVQLDPLTEAAAVPAWELDMELEELDTLGYVARLRDGRVEARIVPCFLETWSEDRIASMHRRLAQARRDEPDARMRHWLACGEVALAVNAADEAAAVHMSAARFGKAKGAYAAALRAARGCGRDDLMEPLLEGYVEAALCDISLSAANDAEQHAARMAAEPGPRLVALARAFRHGLMGEWASAWATAAAVAPFRAGGLEGVRLGVMVRAANLGKVADVNALLVECHDAFQGSPTSRATHLSWRGLVAYANGEFASALDLQRQALAEGPTLRRRLAILANLSVALIDSLQLAEAMQLGAELERVGRELRAPGYERWGAAARSEAAYRQRLPLEAMSEDLRRGISGVGNDLTCCNMLLTYAAAAWRDGRFDEVRRLAADAAAAAERVNRVDSGVVPRALAAAAGVEVDVGALLIAVDDPRLHVRQVGQVLALLMHAGVARDRMPQGPLHAVVVTPHKSSETRLEVLDWEEVLAYLGATPPRNPE